MKALLFTIAAAIPFLVVCVILYFAGVFDKFWFWTFTYARKYVGKVPLSLVPIIFFNNAGPIIASQVFLWLAAAVGLIACFAKRSLRGKALFTVGLLLFSFVAVSTGFYYRPHYFVLMLPAVALLVGVGFVCIAEFVNRAKASSLLTGSTAIVAVVIFGYTIFQQHSYFFKATPFQIIRATYGINPFPESLKIAEYIKENTSPDDRIVVFGSEPQIYFYANRKSATGYIYMYDLMATHEHAPEMQQEMIDEIERAKPEIAVIVSPAIISSWLPRENSPVILSTWLKQTLFQKYLVVGMIDIFSMAEANYVWGKDIATYAPKSKTVVHILRRKPGL